MTLTLKIWRQSSAKAEVPEKFLWTAKSRMFLQTCLFLKMLDVLNQELDKKR